MKTNNSQILTHLMYSLSNQNKPCTQKLFAFHNDLLPLFNLLHVIFIKYINKLMYKNKNADSDLFLKWLPIITFHYKRHSSH